MYGGIARRNGILSHLVKLVFDDEGSTLVEYGMLILLIAVATIVVVKSFGAQVAALFAPIASSL